MANAQTISKVIKEIKAAYPRFVVEDVTVKIWAVYLVDLPDDLLMNAVRKFISSSTHAFPPSIPEIRSIATQGERFSLIALLPHLFTGEES